MTIVSASTVAASGAAAMFCLAISLVPSPNPLAARIERLERIAERLPAARHAAIDRVLDDERRTRMRDRLATGGWYAVSPAALILRGVAGLFAGLAVGIALMLVLPSKPLALLLGALIATVGWRLPKIALDRAIRARRERIARELPDFLDLLAATVRAGLALNGALIYATEAIAGPLHDELLNTLAEIRLGRSRTDALNGLAGRVGEPQTRTMVTAIVQAERLGANLSAVLHELAVDTRNRRWMMAEESAAKLPIKMLFPMALFMLPSLYIMIFTPVAARMLAR
jgi:tight adherence protein C